MEPYYYIKRFLLCTKDVVLIYLYLTSNKKKEVWNKSSLCKPPEYSTVFWAFAQSQSLSDLTWIVRSLSTFFNWYTLSEISKQLNYLLLHRYIDFKTIDVLAFVSLGCHTCACPLDILKPPLSSYWSSEWPLPDLYPYDKLILKVIVDKFMLYWSTFVWLCWNSQVFNSLATQMSKMVKKCIFLVIFVWAQYNSASLDI